MSDWFRLPLFVTRHVLFALVAGSIGGMLFILFLLKFDHFSSTQEFCTTCHSMTFATDFYEQSAHFNSPSGVRASCGDCHVSEGVFAATWDHILGTADLLKQIFGPDYDDPVVNVLTMPESAFTARHWFRKTGSATCARCHELTAIQGTRADTNAIHLEETEGKGCVDCHINLVHRPVPGEKTFKRDAWNRMVEEEFGLEPGEADQVFESIR